MTAIVVGERLLAEDRSNRWLGRGKDKVSSQYDMHPLIVIEGCLGDTLAGFISDEICLSLWVRAFSIIGAHS